MKKFFLFLLALCLFVDAIVLAIGLGSDGPIDVDMPNFLLYVVAFCFLAPMPIMIYLFGDKK